MIRDEPGTPLMIISHNAINLESPSEKTLESFKETLDSKLAPKPREMEVIAKLKKKMEINKEVKRIHKSRKAKGPNPLSCKKSKKNKLKLQQNSQNKSE